jgi:hypothetical protein
MLRMSRPWVPPGGPGAGTWGDVPREQAAWKAWDRVPVRAVHYVAAGPRILALAAPDAPHPGAGAGDGGGGTTEMALFRVDGAGEWGPAAAYRGVVTGDALFYSAGMAHTCLAAGYADGALQLWAVDPAPVTAPVTPGGPVRRWAGPVLVQTLEGHTARVTAVRAAADGNRVVSMSAAGDVMEWDVLGLCPLRTLPPAHDVTHAAYAAPDGALMCPPPPRPPPAHHPSPRPHWLDSVGCAATPLCRVGQHGTAPFPDRSFSNTQSRLAIYRRFPL